MSLIKKICVLFICFGAVNAWALSILKVSENAVNKQLIYTSYSDYFPFGYKTNQRSVDTLSSVFKDSLLELLPQNKTLMSFRHYPTLKDTIYNLNDGKIDVFLGAFYATESFNNLDFIFPSVLNNPIHLIMVPNKISQVKKASDLKALKGIYLENEMFGDYMLKTFQNLNMTPVENADKAYEALLTGQADFILGSYYYHYAQIVERGLKEYVAFSSTPLWNMPMFIALSKNIQDRKEIHEYFKRLASSDGLKNTILNHIKKLISEKEQQSLGVVPPMYVRKTQQKEQTPADEPLKRGEN